MLREISDSLRDKRHDKIKMRGLFDYQKQIERCIGEQVNVSKLLAALQIYQKVKQIEQKEQETKQISDSAAQSNELR